MRAKHAAAGVSIWAGCIDLPNERIIWKQVVQIAFYLGEQTVTCAELMGCLLGVATAIEVLSQGQDCDVQSVCEQCIMKWMAE